MRFRVGQRVRIKSAVEDLPAGALGVVTNVFLDDDVKLFVCPDLRPAYALMYSEPDWDELEEAPLNG